MLYASGTVLDTGDFLEYKTEKRNQNPKTKTLQSWGLYSMARGNKYVNKIYMTSEGNEKRRGYIFKHGDYEKP